MSESATAVIEAARAKGLKLATAESCTGGLIGGALTGVAGSSAAYVGGVVAYANEAKTAMLSVSPAMFEMVGAVSEEVAQHMAAGAKIALSADLAVSVTGIAGPGGGTKDKPVGTVWIGICGSDEAVAHHHVFEGDREAVRAATVEAALGHLHRAVEAEAGNVG